MLLQLSLAQFPVQARDKDGSRVGVVVAQRVQIERYRLKINLKNIKSANYLCIETDQGRVLFLLLFDLFGRFDCIRIIRQLVVGILVWVGWVDDDVFRVFRLDRLLLVALVQCDEKLWRFRAGRLRLGRWFTIFDFA